MQQHELKLYYWHNGASMSLAWDYVASPCTVSESQCNTNQPKAHRPLCLIIPSLPVLFRALLLPSPIEHRVANPPISP